MKKIVTLLETGPGIKLEIFQKKTSLSQKEVEKFLDITNRKIHKSVYVKNALSITNGYIKVDGIAGLINFNRDIQLEIIPKFLNPENTNWKDDFFAMSLLTEYGKIISEQKISSSKSAKNLHDLISKTLVETIIKELRKPIRLYKRSTWSSFEIDGTVLPEDFLTPAPEGFSQKGLKLSKDNIFNNNISSALKVLMTEVQNADLKRTMSKIIQSLGPQSTRIGRRYKRTPSRYSNWEDANTLSYHINSGGGVSLSSSNFDFDKSPGFIVNTTYSWEKLLLLTIRYGTPQAKVSKSSFYLGSSTVIRAGRIYSSDVKATPDIYIDGEEKFLVDAKYKNPGGKKRYITSTDLYESLAFMKASKTNTCILAYPMPIPPDSSKSGEVKLVEEIVIENQKILACQISLNNFSIGMGFRQFSKDVSKNLNSVFASSRE